MEVETGVRGRLKSWRRSGGEAFLKEEETPPILPEMTPLRWRSASSKNMHILDSQTATELPASQSDRPPSLVGTVSPTTSEQAASLDLPIPEGARATNRSFPEAVPLPEVPSDNDHVSKSNQANQNTKDIILEAPEAEKAHKLPSNGADAKVFVDEYEDDKDEPPEEIIDFQPVDLDQKYRRKELIKHITAAKIQNREESLLNNPNLPRKKQVPTGDEPAAMTIEFLRARLLAERQASKVTKQQISQLTKKVTDLEARLTAELESKAAEVELRKKVEVALQEAMAKLNQTTSAVELNGKEVPSASTAGSPASEIVQMSAGEGVQGDSHSLSSSDLPSIATVLRPESCDVCLEKECSASSKTGLGDAAEVPVSLGSDEVTGKSSGQFKGNEDARAAVEERLQVMWRQLGQEMTALAEVKSSEERKELIGWIGQVPKVLQSKQSESTKLSVGSKLGVILPESLIPARQSTSAKVEEITTSDKARVAIDAGNSKQVEEDRQEELTSNSVGLKGAHTNSRQVSEAKTVVVQEEDEVPALVTEDGDVLREKGPDGLTAQATSTSSTPGVKNKAEGQGQSHVSPLSKDKSVERASRQSSTHLSKPKSVDSSVSPPFIRTRTKSFDLSQETTGIPPRRASFNGTVEFIANARAEKDVSDELVDDEDAEELPNGIFLHHSKDDNDSYRRYNKDMYRRTTERLIPSRRLRSPNNRSDRVLHVNGYSSPRSRSDRGSSRERVRMVNGSGVDEADWAVRDLKDRNSRDVYYAPMVNSRHARSDLASQVHPAFEKHLDESHFRVGVNPRWDSHMVDASWGPRLEERRVCDPHLSRSSSEDGSGRPRTAERDARGASDNLDPDGHYKGNHRQRGEFGYRGEYSRGMPPPWQDMENPGLMRSRSTGQRSYPYGTPYVVDEPYIVQSPDVHVRPDMFYSSPVPATRPEYYPQFGMPVSRAGATNGHSVGPEILSDGNRGFSAWESDLTQQERTPSAVTNDDGSGKAGEVLKALRIAKQQIKSATGEQQAYMTAQYTVSSEHRYGAGGQVSKTSYTVEAPVGYAPRVTKAFHEGWVLEGKPNKLGKDDSSPKISEMNGSAGPLAIANGESSYVEKLNVGRGIQFFFP